MECAVLARDHSTKGGSRETELKLLAVTPTGLAFSSIVLTMVTPVANCPSALRNSCGLGSDIIILRRNHSLKIRKRTNKSKE